MGTFRYYTIKTLEVQRHKITPVKTDSCIKLIWPFLCHCHVACNFQHTISRCIFMQLSHYIPTFKYSEAKKEEEIL